MDDVPRVDGAGSKRDGCSIAPAGAPGGTSSCRAIYRLPQFTPRFIGLVFVLAAIWLALWPLTNVGSRVVLAAIILTVIFGCARTRRAAAVMLPALYVPHLWVFLIGDYPWSDYRWYWAKMFWQLPGMAPEALTGHQWRTEARQHFWMALFAVAIWLTTVTLARRGGYWLWGTAIAVFLLSLLCSQLEQALFRM